MKRMILSLLLLTGAMAISPEPVFAVYRTSCDCDPGTTSCKCDAIRYTLGKLATQEFRGNCTNTTYEWAGIMITDRDKGTTCTIPALEKYGEVLGTGSDYTSKSCTNWDVFTKDTLTLQLKCCTEASRELCGGAF